MKVFSGLSPFVAEGVRNWEHIFVFSQLTVLDSRVLAKGVIFGGKGWQDRHARNARKG